MRTIILFTLTALLMVGCTTTTAVKEGSEISDTPDWVQSMGLYEKGIGAIGSSPKSNLGSQVQREDATLVARNELAKSIESKVQSSISQTRQRLIEQGIAGAEELGTLQTQNAARQLVNMKLNRSRPLKQWKDPESGELYVWVVIDEKDLVGMQSDMHSRVVRKSLKDADKQHDQTIKETFDEEFKKEFSN